MSEENINNIQVGTPTMVLLPARNYCFKVVSEEHKIVIPREGDYNKLAPEVFSKEAGSFFIMDEESKTLYMPAISKVLFATSKYPDLKSNQLFAPMAVVFNEKDVEVIGIVIEMLLPNQAGNNDEGSAGCGTESGGCSGGCSCK